MIEVHAPDGTVVKFPEDTPDDTIKTVMRKNFGGPETAPSVDESRGAPLAVRSAVGAAERPEDRLATLRRYYPDAQPREGENFVFTDPETKRPTLYNPKGFDPGDIPSVGPEIAEYVGGTIGAALATPPAIAGAIPTGGTSLLSVPAAMGLGAAAGREGYSLLSQMAGTQDTRGGLERLGDTATTFAVNASGARIGELLQQGGRAALNAAVQSPIANRVRDFVALGVEPRAGAVSNSRVIQGLEKGLESTTAGQGRMQTVAERTIGQVQAAADRTARLYGRVLSKAGAGDVVKEGAAGAAQRIKNRQEEIYNQAFDRVGRDTPVPLPNVARYSATVQQELSQAPESLARTLTPTLERTQALLRDAGDRGVPFDTLRQLRTDLGKDLDNPVVLGATGSQHERLNGLYQALTQDMRTAAEQAGAGRELATADRYTRFQMNQTAPTLQKIADIEEPGKVFNWALSGSKDDALRLSRIRRSLRPEEWDDFAGTVLGRMGLAKPGVQDAAGEAFSVNAFLTNWNNLSPEAKNALFGGSRYAELRPQLNRLTRVVEGLKETEKMANFSGTARALSVQAILGALGIGGVSFAGGDAQTTGTALAGTILAPAVTARLITSPAFVRWLASAPSAASGGAEGMAAHFARLVGIGKAEPAIREEIRQYFDALRGVPAPATAEAK